MDFFNIGGGELLVIILLALVLFRPEDIYKAMRTLGRYTRSARGMWSEFSTNIKREMDAQEVEEALKETKGLMTSAQEAVDTLKTSVSDVKKAVEADVSEAGQSLKSQAAEGAAAAKAQGAAAVAESATAPKVTVEAIAAAVSEASADAESVAASVKEIAAGGELADGEATVEPEPAGTPEEASATEGSAPEASAAEGSATEVPAADVIETDVSEAEDQLPESVGAPDAAALDTPADNGGEDSAQAADKGVVPQASPEAGKAEAAESVVDAAVPTAIPEAEPAEAESPAPAAPKTDADALAVTDVVGEQPDSSAAPLTSEPNEES